MNSLITPWSFAVPYALNDCPPRLAEWLQVPGSMTKRLLAASQQTLEVIVLRQEWQQASLQESRFLRLLPRSQVFVRETLLCGYGIPWMFARSIFPQHIFTGKNRWLLSALDTTPIGTLFYRHPCMQRSSLQFAKLDQRHWEYHNMMRYVDNLPNPVWARRSCFYLHQKPLLVSEFLLPAIGEVSCLTK